MSDREPSLAPRPSEPSAEYLGTFAPFALPDGVLTDEEQEELKAWLDYYEQPPGAGHSVLYTTGGSYMARICRKLVSHLALRVSPPSGTPPRTPYGDPLPTLTPAEREDPEVQAAASRHDDLHPCGSYGGDLIVAKAMLDAARGARASRSEPPPPWQSLCNEALEVLNPALDTRIGNELAPESIVALRRLREHLWRAVTGYPDVGVAARSEQREGEPR